MDDKGLDKYLRRSSDPSPDQSPPEEAELTDDLGAFGFVRGTRDRAVCLELRRKTGNILAIGYGWIERFEFDPSEGITIHALGRQVCIRGRNLNAEVRPNIRLFESLTRHKASWVQEADEPTLVSSKSESTIVETIEW
ncbi:MAG TPA: hypothetical protein VGN17_28455 [Bryobacteraceae bacterium]|jgi:hypothetical protein